MPRMRPRLRLYNGADTMKAMTTDFDPYSILQVDPAAEPEIVRASYESLRSLYGDDAAGRLREIETAFRILNDPEQRRAYDERRAAAANPATVVELPVFGATAGGETDPKVAWTLSDIYKALILPLVFVTLNVSAGFLVGVDEDQLSATDYATNFTFALVVEGVFFFLAYRFAVRKYGGRWADLGFRRPQGVRWWFPFGLLGQAFAVLTGFATLYYFLGIGGESNVPEGAYDNLLPLALLALLSVVVAPGPVPPQEALMC